MKQSAASAPVAAHIGAGAGPDRNTPPAAVVPVSTGGLFPRDYRRRLRENRTFNDVSEFDSATICHEAPTPLIGTAIHYSGRLRRDLQPKLGLPRADLFYEEDPETEKFLGKFLHTITPNQSRFEFDINRPPDTTIYSKPSLAWGMKVWNEPLDQYEKEFSLEKWYEFHTMMDCAVEDAIERFGYAVVFDFHSYNYQRKGPVDWRTDGKPVINLGTRHLNLDQRGEAIKDLVVSSLKGHTVDGDPALVEENGVFYGGYLNRRLSHLYGPRCITLSVEYKKVYMDERTGEIFHDTTADMVKQLEDTVTELADHLQAPIREGSELPFLRD